MAEPNYLAEVNRARMQARTGRKSRLNEIVDSLDSAGAMDRLQGADVGDFSPNMDTGASGILATTVANVGSGGGGGGVPVRTAGYPSSSGPVYSSPCGPGGCPAPGGYSSSMPVYTGQPSYQSSPMITSGPFTSSPSVVTSAPISTTVSSPAFGRPARKDGESESAYQLRLADEMEDQAVQTARSNPTVGALLRMGATDHRRMGMQLQQRDDVLSEKERVWKLMLPYNETRRLNTEADTAQKRSEAEVNIATAQLAREASGVGSSEDTQQLLNDVIENRLNPQIALDGAMKMYGARASTDPTGKMAVANAQIPRDQELKLRRMFYGGAAIGVLMRTADAHYAASNALSGELRPRPDSSSVAKDPATGQPVEIKGNRSAFERASATNNIAIDNLVAGYNESNLLGGNWFRVKTSLYTDVYSPMLQASEKLFFATNAERLAGLGGQEKATVEAELRDAARAYTDKAYGYIESKLSEANGKMGGGTITNPNGNWQTQLRDALRPDPAASGMSPQAWGAAPALMDRAE